MDHVILDNINKVVGQDDTLYILGDFCFRGKKPIEYRSRVFCQDVHLILGNHDKRTDFISNNTVDMSGFSSIQEVKEIIYCNQRIYLSHYPHRSWPASHKSSWMLYGHVHGRLNREDIASGSLTLDVGVDNKRDGVEFGTPWSFKDVQQQFLARTKKISRSPIDIDDTILYNRRNNAR